MIYHFISSLLLLFLLSTNLYANTISEDNVDYSIEVLLDPTNSLTLDEAKDSHNYSKITKGRLGFIDQTVWFHIQAKKKLPSTDIYYLQYKFTYIHNLIAYEYKDGQFSNTFHFGSIYPLDKSKINYKNFTVSLDFDGVTQFDYYIKVKHMGSIPTLFTFLKKDTFLQMLLQEELTSGIVFGLLLVMIFYNLILFYVTKFSYYLYYVVLVASSLMYHFTIRGFSKHYLWPDSVLLATITDNLFALLFILSGAVFIIKLLDITLKKHPKIFTLLIIELGVVTLLLLSTIFFKASANPLLFKTNALAMVPIIALFLSVIFSAYYLAVKGSRTAVLFSIAWSFFTLSLIVYVLQIMGILPTYSWTNNLIAFGSVSEVVLLAFILSDKIKIINKERVNLQYDNHELEQKVDERTKELQHQLYTDQLTGLKNRFSLIGELQKSSSNLIILVDIDGFSQINDLFGINIGNQVLIKLANKLQALTKVNKMSPFRLGGDEFILHVVLQKDENIQSYVDIAKKLQSTLESENYNIEEINENFELSITIAIAYNQTNLLNKADMTIDIARKEGKKVLVYQDSFNHTHELQKNLYYKKEIRLALEEDRFICFFQPIVSSKSSKQKFELLMRLKQIENGVEKIISPFEFLDISIKTNQYENLSRYVLEKGLRSVQHLECDITLNLSFIEIKNPEFRQWFKEILQKYNMFERVVIEILEDSNLQDYDLVTSFTQEFQGYGARIAIDDFGSGFSNFTHIMELRPNYIKIDGSIIKNINNDASSYSVVKAIVLLAKEIDAKVIAEYVHCEEVYEIVKELGVDEFQGYYISEPKPIF